MEAIVADNTGALRPDVGLRDPADLGIVVSERWRLDRPCVKHLCVDLSSGRALEHRGLSIL